MSTITDLLFPPVCISCGALLPYRGFFAKAPLQQTPLCKECFEAWEKEKNKECGICQNPVSKCNCITRILKAAGCKSLHKLVFYRPGEREDVGNRIIYHMKDHANAATVQFLAHELAKRLKPTLENAEWANRPVFLTFLPRRKSKVLIGGNDQAKELARALAKELALPLIPLIGRSSKSETPQKYLQPKQRRQNAKTAFYLRPEFNVKDMAAILVDDIVTSGASMAAGVRILRSAGVRYVLPVAVATDECNQSPELAVPEIALATPIK